MMDKEEKEYSDRFLDILERIATNQDKMNKNLKEISACIGWIENIAVQFEKFNTQLKTRY